MSGEAPTVRLACLAPVFAYGLLLILLHPLRWSVLSAAAVVALALPLVAMVTTRFAGWIYVPAAIVVGVAAVAWLNHPAVGASPFADLAMGILIGAPLVIFAAIAEHRRSLSAVVLGLFGGLGFLELDLATVRALPSAGPVGPSGWSSLAATQTGDQLASLSQWAAGASVAPPPLGYVGDVWFDALALLGASGILLSWLAFDARLDFRPVGGLSGRPPPPGPAWTGVRSLVVAMGAILAFELAAALNPVASSTGAVVGVAVTSLVIAWFVRPAAGPRIAQAGRGGTVAADVRPSSAD